MSTLSFTAQQLYNMLTDAHCNCKQYISVDQNGLLILANESRNSYGVFEDIPITKDFIIEYDLTLGSNSNPCCNPTFGSYIKPNSAQYYGFMLSFSSGGELWIGENNSLTTAQQSLGMSGTAWYGTPNTTYHIKIERDDNTVNLYVDDVLIQTVSDNTIRTTEGGYFGFFNWNGYTCKISNVTITSDTYSNIKKYTNVNGVAEIWANTKNYIASQLLGKSNVGHTHSASEITDLQERWDYDSDSNAILVRGGSDVWTYDQQNDSVIIS